MAKVYLEDSELTNIGNAIREKTNSSGLLLPSEMPVAIQSIKSGSPATSFQVVNGTPKTNGGHCTTYTSVNTKATADKIIAIYCDYYHTLQGWSSSSGVYYTLYTKENIAISGDQIRNGSYKVGDCTFTLSGTTLTGKYYQERGSVTSGGNWTIAFKRAIVVYYE